MDSAIEEREHGEPPLLRRRGLLQAVLLTSLMLCWPGPAAAQMATGSYVGGTPADDKPITGVGFAPDIVIIKGDGNFDAVIRTSTMTGDASKECAFTTLLLPDRIQSFQSDGFTVGSDNRVNQSGTTYYWIAFKSWPGLLTVGSYDGTNADNVSVPVGFSPDYVLLVFGGDRPVHRWSGMSGDASHMFNGFGALQDYIQAIEPNGFQVGTLANASGTTYHWVAWNDVPGKMKASSYPGTNGDNYSIPGIGFQPDYVIIQRDGSAIPIHKPASTGPSTDASLQFSGGGLQLDHIQALETDGFQVGRANAVNMNNNTYFYAAFKDFSTTAVTLASFEATGSDGAVRLEWRTDSELDNLGFNLYRAPSAAGPYERITASLMPGLGSSATGARYSYRDTGLTNGLSYYYKLEDVEGTGRTVLHGPVSATPQAGAADAASSSDDSPSSDASSSDSASPARITYGDPSSVGLRVVRQGAQGLELELLTAGFYATAETDGSVRLEIPGFEVAGAPGSPAVPVKRSFLEAVAGRQVKIAAVVPEDVVSFTSLRPALAELPELVVGRDGTLRAGARKARGVWRSRGLYPDEAARVVSVAFQGEVKKALVELSPLRWDAGTGQLLLARRLRVRLVFSGQETGELALGGSRGRAPRSPHGTGRDPGNSDRLVTRLVTRQRGLYAVGFEQLFAGQQRAVSASQLRLSRLGRDVAFHLEPNGPHFGPGARLYFLSEGGASSAYANEAVYELWLGSVGTQMPVASASPSGARLAYALKHQQWETNRYYLSGLLEASDLWQWDSIVSGNRKAFPFRLSGLAAASEPAGLRVWLQGASDFDASPDHHLRAYLNGSWVGEASWDGKRPQSLLAQVAPGILREGDNLLELENVADTAAAHSLVYFDRFALDSPQTLVAEAGSFEASFGSSGTASLAGLGAGSLVLDTSEAASPRWLSGTLASPGELSLAAEAGHRYLAIAPQALLSPELRWPSPSDLRSSSNQADYILVAPRELLPAATPLLERRQAEGLSTRAVALEQIFDSFGYGERSAEAIRDFLSYAYQRWSAPAPRYVLLLGDATLDPKDYAGTGVKDQLPALMFRSSYLWTASDPGYAAVNGEDELPDLAIGRLPAGSLAQAESLIQKLLAYEAGEFDFRGPAVLVADNPDQAGNFEANAEEIASGLLSGHETEKIYLSRLGTTATRAAILHAFDQGASLMSYIGHGGTALWASENLLNIWDMPKLTPQAQQPLLFTMNCLNGYFLPPVYDSLAEALLKAEDKGAIAAFSPSGLSVDRPAHLYHKALLREILSGRHARLGDAILAAQSEYATTGAFPELLRLYHLFGDPALNLR